MGYRKVPTIYTLNDLKGEEGLVIRMKAIRIGKLRSLIRIVDAGEEGLAEGLDEIFKLLHEGLVSWNLEDEEGVHIPETMESIEEQELPFILSILSAWLENMTGPDEELGKDSPSGVKFPGQLPTMEAL